MNISLTWNNQTVSVAQVLIIHSLSLLLFLSSCKNNHVHDVNQLGAGWEGGFVKRKKKENVKKKESGKEFDTDSVTKSEENLNFIIQC